MMETKELKRLIACAELRNPKTYNASRERYIVEISFKAGREAEREWALSNTYRNVPLEESLRKAGDKVGYDRAMAQLADMTEECK